jgi:hypothetical protein
MNRDVGPELRWWQHGAVFLGTLILLASRRPDAVFNAQFYAEDGRVFFEDAYNLGWRTALFHPYGGYFHAVPRLASALALLVPLSFAPLVLNLIALGLQALPVSLLLSQRSLGWGSFRARLLMAGLYLALPNCGEASANITNAQCSLALIALLLLVASPPASAWRRCAEGLLLLLFGLSGPYCILLFPIAVVAAWPRSGSTDSNSKRSDSWRWVQLAILTVTGMVEGWSLLFLDREGRMHYALGASWAGLARILGGQIYLGALLGPNGLGVMQGFGALFALVCVAVGCSAIVGICFLRSRIEMRSLIGFSCIVLGASLVSPMILTRKGQMLWQALAGAGGEHYWFFPILAFAWSLAQCSLSRRPWLRFASAYLLCLMCIGIIHDWRHPAFKDLDFAESAKRFENASPGTVTDFAENPGGWKMQLIKR